MASYGLRYQRIIVTRSDSEQAEFNTPQILGGPVAAGLGMDSAQQIIAEVGAKAATFASAKNLVSWVGACPGENRAQA